MKTEVKAVFQDFNAGSKKDVIKFEVKGDLSDEQIVALHKLKGGTVFVHISSAQRDIDDLEDDEHEGVEYRVNPDSTVDVSSKQMSFADVPPEEKDSQELEQSGDVLPEGEEDELPDNPTELQEEQSDKVTDIEQERKRRGRPKKNNEPEQPEPPAVDTDDDELPF